MDLRCQLYDNDTYRCSPTLTESSIIVLLRMEDDFVFTLADVDACYAFMVYDFHWNLIHRFLVRLICQHGTVVRLVFMVPF